MAITQVRARFGTEWVDLTYNPATGRYEGYVTPGGTSYHQPGGYFAVEAEVTNDTGQMATASGSELESLRLVVRETVAPSLTLISPAAGYLNTQTPTFVFEATDDGGGSGVDPDSFTPAPSSVTEIPNGYRFIWTPPEAWGEGNHTLTASVADYDGNLASVSAAYFVDTVPPSLILRKPYMLHIFDTAEIEVTAEASDLNGVASVTIGGVEISGNGMYTRRVPLEVGENHIVVTATDAAGNQTSETLYAIRLVTDRTAADVERVRELEARGVDNWTDAEREWFNTAIVRGAYNETDLNRVGAAVRYLAEELRKRGYSPSTALKTDWQKQDAPTESQMKDYLKGVRDVVIAQPLVYLLRQPLPSTIRNLNTTGANQIEKALTQVEEPFSRYRSWSCGEITCGPA